MSSTIANSNKKGISRVIKRGLRKHSLPLSYSLLLLHKKVNISATNWIQNFHTIHLVCHDNFYLG